MANLDVLDKKGNKTGKVKPKSRVHADGDWHRAAHVWIINSKGQVLIQKRSSNKDSYPNMWDISAAGHVDAGEDSPTAAIREIEEELGLKFNKPDLEHVFSLTVERVLNNRTFFNNEFDDIYLVKKDIGLSQIKVQKSEISEVKYIGVDELEKKLRSNDKDYVPKDEKYYNLLFTAIKERDAEMNSA